MGNSQNYYSKKNPLGPYAGATRPNTASPKPSDYIEGFNTKKNLAEWSARATRNSNPSRDAPKKRG